MSKQLRDDGVLSHGWSFSRVEVDETDDVTNLTAQTSLGLIFEASAPTLEEAIAGLLADAVLAAQQEEAACRKADTGSSPGEWPNKVYLVMSGRSLSLYNFPDSYRDYLGHVGSRYVTVGPHTGHLPVGLIGKLTQTPKEVLSFFDDADDA